MVWRHSRTLMRTRLSRITRVHCKSFPFPCWSGVWIEGSVPVISAVFSAWLELVRWWKMYFDLPKPEQTKRLGMSKTAGIRRIEQRNLLIWCYENMRNKARVGIQEIGWKNQAVARLFFCWYRSIVKLFALFASLDNRKHRELSVKRWTS